MCIKFFIYFSLFVIQTLNYYLEYIKYNAKDISFIVCSWKFDTDLRGRKIVVFQG